MIDVWNKNTLQVMNKLRKSRDSSTVAYIEEAFKQERARVIKRVANEVDKALWKWTKANGENKLQFKDIIDNVLKKVSKK